MPICPNCGQYYVRAPCPSCGYMGETGPNVPAPPVVKEEAKEANGEEHVLKPSEYVPLKEAKLTEKQVQKVTQKTKQKPVEASLESLKGYINKTKTEIKKETPPAGVDAPYRKKVMEKLLEIRNLIDEILEM